MGSHSKKHKDKDSKKKKKHSKKKSRSRSPSTSSSSSSSSSSTDRKNGKNSSKSSKKDSFSNLFGSTSSKHWELTQKSETLLFEKDPHHDHHDSQTTTFIWRKKNEKMGINDLEEEEIRKMNLKRQEEAKKELEKLNKRKLEHEREVNEREREREFLQRQKEAEYHKEWEKQEDSFHLKQVKMRSKIRIEEARAKPIDLLAQYIDEDEDNLIVDMHEPYTYLNGLTIRDLEDLLVDIKVYSDLERNKHNDYWSDMTIITQDELKKLQQFNNNDDSRDDRREGINQSVLHDVSVLFRGKNFEQLKVLEMNITKKIKEESGIDIGYWESVLAQLKPQMARARLRESHQDLLKRKLERLKTQQGIVSSERPQKPLFPIDEIKPTTKQTQQHSQVEKVQEKQEAKDIEEDEDDLFEACIEAYESGNYSPKLLSPDDLSFDAFVISQDEDMKRIEYKRAQVMTGGGKVSRDNEEEFEKKSREQNGADLESLPSGDAADTFNTEHKLEPQHYLWSDKYRPRKPRYYNRVHTGYDWNQYNKKHYDTDNPPPKTVQGYKFNILYPDLIDKTKTPTYTITPCPDNKDFAIIRFHAGPPYEDVAFKIVNREWDISYRHGFKNQFQNGTFQLHFHFRKWKYRR